ncbi:MAG: DUF507 family protein [Terriglobia bacterium]
MPELMKLSHEKIIQLSHRIMAAIEALDEVEIFEESNTIRQETVKILTELMHEEEKIDGIIKARIASQKRTIPEGSGEWEILYRKYYNDELRKFGVVFNSPNHP